MLNLVGSTSASGRCASSLPQAFLPPGGTTGQRLEAVRTTGPAFSLRQPPGRPSWQWPAAQGEGAPGDLRCRCLRQCCCLVCWRLANGSGPGCSLRGNRRCAAQWQQAEAAAAPPAAASQCACCARLSCATETVGLPMPAYSACETPAHNDLLLHCAECPATTVGRQQRCQQ